ncbi:phosphatase PAP2 family protein [Alistipes sp.]|uniref:phosphatase PAP2 family protein n=1 Tax=Alistipes sp. TaxID=1872444 RepID=UPI003AF0A0BA
MLRLLLCCLLAVSCQQLVAQHNDLAQIDNDESFALRFHRHTSTKAYRMTFVATPLILGGVAMMYYDRDFRELRNDYSPKFNRHYDNYLQYAPLALTWGMKACGLKGRSSWGRMIVSNAFAAGLMAAVVNSLKYSVQVERPDGSTRNSFPSGHTATAFMAATILHKEYGHRSPWFSILGYAAATATGVTRQLNNRHWMSDVMVGAGIGILSAELGYFLADLIYQDRGLYAYDKMVVLDRYAKPSFLGLSVGFSTALGRYSPLPGRKVVFTSGPTVSIRGAWFATPYVGVGGRVQAGNLAVTVDDVAQTERLKSASAAAGVYFSYPFTARWLIGSKVLGGYEYYKTMDLKDRIDGTDQHWISGKLGGRGGFVAGTGLTMVYAATQHLGVRFETEYDITCPSTPGSDEWMSRLSFGLAVCALF